MKKIILFVIFFSLAGLHASEDCKGSSKYRVLSQYMYYDYIHEDGNHRLLKKEKRTTEVFEVWSEVAGKLFGIYFESKNGNQPDKVRISYKFKDKVLYKKDYSLENSSLSDTDGDVSKVVSFTFSDGVRDKKKRPGVQYYKFYKGDKELCELKVKHIFATEDN